MIASLLLTGYLRDALLFVADSASPNSKFELGSVLFDFHKKGTVVITSANGHSGIMIETTISTCGYVGQFLIDQSNVKLILNEFKGETTDIHIYMMNDGITFTNGVKTRSCRSMPGGFPDYHHLYTEVESVENENYILGTKDFKLITKVLSNHETFKVTFQTPKRPVVFEAGNYKMVVMPYRDPRRIS